jgi:FlgD Ig-like domain
MKGHSIMSRAATHEPSLRATFVAIVLMPLLGPGLVVAGQYTTGWHSIYSSGPALSGGVWTLTATVGQPEAGRLSGGSYTLTGGFWPAQSGAYSVGVGNSPTDETPVSLALDAPSPNPLIGERTVARFALPQAQFVRVRVFDIHGRIVRRLVDASLPAGFHQSVWDGTDDSGRRAGPGIYLLSVEAGRWRSQRKIAVLR